jgi:tetratricopeptide (TPR) repeat protein
MAQSGRPPARGSGRPTRSRPSRPRTGEPERGRASGSAGPSRERIERPDLPTEADWQALDADVRAELRSLPKNLAQTVGAHLHAAGLLLAEDPDAAYQHALTARRLASRVAICREAAGLTAYGSGRWPEAISELRAFARMSGSRQHLPLVADSERALGRPLRALELTTGDATKGLPADVRAELLLVAAGARRDLGQLDAALVALQAPAQHSRADQPWAARVRYAYADALLAADRRAEAVHWFTAAAQVDPDGQTDAEERLLELRGIVLSGDEPDSDEPDSDEPDSREPSTDPIG